jgi:hypothetical protein
MLLESANRQDLKNSLGIGDKQMNNMIKAPIRSRGVGLVHPPQ